MTITSSVSTVTRNGNGVATSFSFPFKVWDKTQLEVFLINPAGESALTTDWDAALSDPGGSVTYPKVGSTKLPTGWKIVILRNMPLTQESDYVNAEPFLAETVEQALDVLTASVQQVKEAVDRSVKIEPGSTNPDAYMTEIRAAVASTTADSVQTGADRVQTGLDRVATGADRVQTGLDRVQTGLDRAAVAADKITVAADKDTVAADKGTVAADKALVAADKATVSGYKDTAVAAANTATSKAADALASASAASSGAGDAEKARAAAVVAQLAAEAAASNVSVRYTNPPIAATEGQTVFNAGFSFSNNYGNVAVFLAGIRQATDAYTLASPNITMAYPVRAGVVFQAFSIDFTAAPSTPLFASNNLSDLANAATARANLGVVDLTLSNLSDYAAAAANLGYSRRSKLINGVFRVNNNGYVSNTALAQGVPSTGVGYGHDGWRAGAGGCTYTFTQSKGPTEITITAGTLISKVEDVDIDQASMILFWTGTAQGRVGVNGAEPSGSYASSPILITATVGASVAVEFGTGTLGKVQLENGAFKTPLEWLPYQQVESLCQRYHPTITAGADIIAYHEATNGTVFNVRFPVTARVAPSGFIIPALSNFAVVNYLNSSGAPTSISGPFSASTQSARMYAGSTAGSPTLVGGNSGALRIGASGYIRFTGCAL